MIETPEQLYQIIEQMGRMQRILESYRNEILGKNARNSAILAEGSAGTASAASIPGWRIRATA